MSEVTVDITNYYVKNTDKIPQMFEKFNGKYLDLFLSLSNQLDQKEEVSKKLLMKFTI